MSAQGNPVYRFADCELDPGEHRLLVNGNAVTLTPKVFETLLLLVENAGHVVSKDRLMATLWPRGFVHESNLTKHIWLIRRALGEDKSLGEEGADSAFIETVPKLGYRFVAAVRRQVCIELATIESEMNPDAGAAHAVAIANEPAHEPVAGAATAQPVDKSALPPVVALPASKAHDNLLRWGAGALAVAAIVFAVHLWRQSLSAFDGSAVIPDNGAVAIVDFNNLSQNAKDAWLGPALEQMLATEIAAGGALHAVPDELVRPARADLSAPAAGGYARTTLDTLRQRLGAHYVLSGAYFVTAAADASQLRIDLAVQDAASGKTIATLSRIGPVAELPQLIAQTGVDLRKQFGLQAVSTSELKLVANAQPPTAEVARRLGFALDALHRYDPARARDELLQAVAQAPGYAPAYAYLAQAWSALGYRAKALAAIGQAAEHMQNLPQEQMLSIQAQQSQTRPDWAQTVLTYRKLVELRPQNPDYRLSVIGALLSAGKPDDADIALAELRKLPGFAGDPRIELAAAHIAFKRGDGKAQLDHARIALQQAQKRGEAGLIAGAQLQLGIASGNSAAAQTLLRQAAAGYRKIGNPHGEALAYQNLANAFFALNQVQAARETYQRAMTIYQGIGDLGGVAAIYDDLSRMLWAAGDRDGAETALREALKIARQTDDLVRQAWSLTGLATILSDESASDEAVQMYQQAIALDETSGERVHHVFALATYVDLLRQRGELDRARALCSNTQTEAKAMADADSIAGADFECAQIALDRGDVDAAVTGLNSVLQRANAAHNTFNAANAQMMLGQIAMGQLRWREARNDLQAALKGWTASEETAGEAVTESQLALCAAEVGDSAERDRAIARANALRVRITQHLEVAALDIALAQLQGETGDHDAAIAKLRALAADADRRLWPGLALEARLAAVQLLERWRSPAARALHGEVERAAHRLGYGWVLARLGGLQQNPGRSKVAMVEMH